MTDLWAVHIEGPDDLIAVPSRAEAERRAAAFNAWCEERDSGVHDPHMRAAVVPWPYTPAAHTYGVLTLLADDHSGAES